MSEKPTETAVAKRAEREMEFVPFGASDKIKLTIAIVQNIVAVPTKQGKTCSERDALKFMMLCQAQRLNPFAGDAFLVGYDGKDGPTFSLITAHQAFLKRAETSADFDGMTSGILVLKSDGSIEEREGDFHLPDEKKAVVGGWAKVFHKTRTHPTFRRIRMERFNKGFAQWEVDPAGMIVKCAEADALRSTFPTLLGGLYTKEELDNQREEERFKLSKPVFAGAPPALFSEPAPVVTAEPAPAPQNNLSFLVDLMAKDSITEAHVVAYMRANSLCDDSLSLLSEIYDVKPSSIATVVKTWGATVKAIRMANAQPA